MASDYECPHCDETIRISDQEHEEGRKFTCSGCRKELELRQVPLPSMDPMNIEPDNVWTLMEV